MKRLTLGLYLNDRAAQALLLEQNSAGARLHALTEFQSSLYTYAGDDTPGVDDFVDQLSAFLHDSSLTPEHVSVALDSSLLFIHAIPVEKDAEQYAVDERIRWELQQFFPDSLPGTFISDVHPLPENGEKSHNTLLTVSVRRERIQKLHRALGRVNLALGIVDVDHFSADNAMRYGYADTGTKQIALVGIKEHRTDISIIRYNDLHSYRFAQIALPADSVKDLAHLAQHSRSLSQIMLYGPSLNRDLIAAIRHATPLPVEVLNPFRSIDVSTSIRSAQEPTSSSYRYAAALGAALRRD